MVEVLAGGLVAVLAGVVGAIVQRYYARADRKEAWDREDRQARIAIRRQENEKLLHDVDVMLDILIRAMTLLTSGRGEDFERFQGLRSEATLQAVRVETAFEGLSITGALPEVFEKALDEFVNLARSFETVVDESGAEAPATKTGSAEEQAFTLNIGKCRAELRKYRETAADSSVS